MIGSLGARPNVPAHQALAQMNPCVSRPQEILAPLNRVYEVLDLVEVCALLPGGSSR